MYLPNVSVERTPVAKTIAKAKRLEKRELLFGISGSFRSAKAVRGLIAIAVCNMYWTKAVPIAQALNRTDYEDTAPPE